VLLRFFHLRDLDPILDLSSWRLGASFGDLARRPRLRCR
jgi:hypothetical protein